MSAAGGDFTAHELRRMLALELTRADASFLRSQRAARAALARDLVAGEERIAAPLLQVERVDLSFELVEVRPGWLARAWTRVRRAFGGAERGPPARFRLAGPGERSVQVSCVLRRDARGRLRAESDPA